VESSLPIESPFTQKPCLPSSTESALITARPVFTGVFRSKAVESTQLARGTLNRYLLILKRLIFESSVRAGSPSLVAAPEGPETCP
jgi:hypothetical protein